MNKLQANKLRPPKMGPPMETNEMSICRNHSFVVTIISISFTLMVLAPIIHIVQSQTIDKQRTSREANPIEPTRVDDNYQIAVSSVDDPGSGQNFVQPSDEDKKFIEEQSKLSLLKLLNLKDVPKVKPTGNQIVHVPQEMVVEYLKTRSSTKEIIPDDRIFLGRLNIDSIIDFKRENYWDELHNKYGGYDLKVDMRQDDETTKSYHYGGEARQISYITPNGDPEDVPKKFEHMLAPHNRNPNLQKPFVSVHIHYNLSQELFAQPLSADELKGAELHLSRDPVPNCESDSCQDEISNIPANENDENQLKRAKQMPRYQRVYILKVIKYNSENEPITSLYDTQRIDVTQTSPLVFNIYPIVRNWLLDPQLNHGIIVRVTNDDKYDHYVATSSINVNNTNNRQVANGKEVIEHVRLKREFHSTSDSNEAWTAKQPFILIYSDPKGDSTGESSGHVKRDSSPADHRPSQPEIQWNANQNFELGTTTNGGNLYNQSVGFSTTSYDDTTGQSKAYNFTSSSSSSSVNRRNSRQTQTTRARSNALRPRGKQMKCGRHDMLINFDEVGWSGWIIAPLSFNAYHCNGVCSYPIADLQNATNHAIIQSIFNSVGRIVPRSCCAPTKFNSLAILYQIDGIVQMKHYDDMIVESCGCL